ncbi:hypothetical protein EDC56_0444 [Sinobacterium caligoides]|uniref:HD/PDEase domain-containing protein n=1 Tax=Sinobacterium caligoides TaxID=933926 RepID=A0A3N2DYT4_9GAMM|nr:hypothetical protein [Sinobacterium caligoides]ROS04927.1 hypothetical protein EDC56_0444 [Sinobacterium caligoides]
MTQQHSAIALPRLQHRHRSGFDVTDKIAVGDTKVVCAEVVRLLSAHFDDLDCSLISTAFFDLEALYSGRRHGYYGCETLYHDLLHVLDVTLAMARLVDGYQQSHQTGALCLTSRQVELGILVALFHDSGYIRRKGDRRHLDGAEYTRTHVSRSARFLGEYLTEVGYQEDIVLGKRLVQFTGYEINPDDIAIRDPTQRNLGYLIGTADLLAQMADANYLNKCRDYLYDEFEKGGIARDTSDGNITVVYSSPVDLLAKTPEFVHTAIETRLEGFFDGVYRYAECHFSGENLYMKALLHNCEHLEGLLAQGDIELLATSIC